jgi:hypothetical protein
MELIRLSMQLMPSILVRYVPRRIFQFSRGHVPSRSSVTETSYFFQNGDDTRVRRRKSLCAIMASRCPPRFGVTPHSRQLHGDATKAISLLARARTRKPRDARARNSLIAICAAGGPRSAGIGRGPRAGPDGSAVCRSPLLHISGMASPPRSAFETT